jgi:hypothetical protein
MKERHPHSTFINDIGPAILVSRLSLTPQALHNWRIRGIPRDLRVAVAKVAAEQGVIPPGDFFDLPNRKFAA